MSVEATNLGTVVSWRVGAGRRGADASGRFWRRGPSGRPGGSRGRQTWRLAGVAMAVSAALALTFWLVSLLRLPRPARLVLVGAGYQANLQIPHNAYGWSGLRDLAQLGDRPAASWLARLCAARYHNNGPPVLLDVQARERWDQALQKIPEPTIIVVMAMHGGGDQNGAYLLPQDARAAPESPDRLRMTDVLKTFARLPRYKKKILILDATGLPYHWELGMLRNHFASELRKLEPEIVKIPNFLVISASSPGERSWSSEAWGRTAFLHFLVEALGGGNGATSTATATATVARPVGRWPSGPRVNLEEVCDDLTSRVSAWADRHRGASQTPMILPSGPAWRTLARSIELPSVQGPADAGPTAVAEGRPTDNAVADQWNHYQRMATSTAAPATAASVPWRRYQELLRRYDELVRAVGPNDTENLADVQAAIQSQELDISRGGSSRLTASRSATLTMPLAEEVVSPDDAPMDPAAPVAAVRTWFDATWWPAAEGKERNLWLDFKAKPPGGDARHLAAQLGELLLGQAISNPPATLDRAARFARLLDQPPQRPAELNFLVMLPLGLPSDWKTTGHVELVRQALRVRRLAERAALGLPKSAAQPDQTIAGPLVAAWIAAKVDEGDRHRRHAEDLLMASDRREACAVAYGQAQLAYDAAIQAGEKVRRAILARDRALSDLMPVTEWLAGCFPPPDQVGLLNEFVTATEDAWKKVHALGQALETPDFAAIDAGPGLNRAAAAVELAHATLKEHIEKRLNSWVEKAGESVGTFGSRFAMRTMVNALTLPWLDRDLRLSILKDGLARLRERDAERGEWKAGSGEPPRPMAVAGEDTSQSLVNVRARLALAILGADATGGEPSQAGPDTTESGASIGARFEARVTEITRLIGRNGAPGGTEWAMNLARLDRLVRVLDGVSNERVVPQATTVDALRFLRLEDYLVNQARRTRADLWHDETSEAVPYDRRVAGAYLDDARELDSRLRNARRDRIDAVRKDLGQPDDIRIVGADTLIVTSEDRSGVRYRLESDDRPDIRAGVAAGWFEAGDGFRIDQPARPADRQAVPLGGSTIVPLDVTLGFGRIPPDAGASTARSSLMGRAFFRGRSLRKETTVERHPSPTRRIVRTPPPPGGGVIVRADPPLIHGLGLGIGAVSIVLDASGSMRRPQGQKEPSKFEEATEALRTVLSQLPQGTVVSVWIFGEAMGEPKTAEFAERTIRRVQKPVAWDPALLDPLMKEVAKIEPWNESPVLRTMLWAADDLRGAAAGFKTLLVLTDGMDNRWLTDKQANPHGLDVTTSLRTFFAGSDIAVNVIGFRVPTPAEREHVRTQFEGVGRFRVPGRFATAEASPGLIAALEQALRPSLRYAVDSGENGPVPAPSPLGFDVQPAVAGALGEPVALPAGSYQLRLLAADQRRCRFMVDDGDQLLVRVLPPGVGIGFERELYSRVAFGLKPAVEEPRSGWRLSAIQNQLLAGPRLQMMATLEQRSDPRDPTLRLARPREVWFDVEAAGGDPPRPGTTIRIADQWGYPAPAWRIDVSSWPTAAGSFVPAAPAINVWWDSDDEAIPSAVVERGREFNVNDDLRGYALSIDGRRVTVESVQVEEHEVEIGDGTKQMRPCLVVRAAYPTDNPVWARPYGVEIDGSEHRFYGDVGKYTGLFWPVTPAQADTAFRRLGLISVASFQRDARRRGAILRLDTVGPPDPRDVSPLPPGRPPVPRPPEPLAQSGTGARFTPAGAK